MLLDDDVVTDREPKPRSLAGRLGRPAIVNAQNYACGCRGKVPQPRATPVALENWLQTRRMNSWIAVRRGHGPTKYSLAEAAARCGVLIALPLRLNAFGSMAG